MRRLLTVPLLVAVMATLAGPALPSPAAAPGPRVIPVPTVSGPVTGGVKHHPFNAAPREPRLGGYVETEYFFSGRATAYDASPDAIASTPQRVPPPPVAAPFTSRMLVRRPADPTRFNGTVLVEWLNDTSGYDVDAAYADMRREIIRAGFAYVGVTAQAVGVAGLKAYDPRRYGKLVHPGDEYSYDIYSQAIQAVLHARARPLGPLQARRVIATGDSQSGSALNHYVTRVVPDVRNVVDGFLVITAADVVGSPRLPVMQILTEEEVDRATRQPDSARFRQWQIAGASHSDQNQGDYLRQTQNRDWGMPKRVNWPLTPSDVPGAQGDCLMGRFPKYLAEHAALDAMNRWITDGTPPRHAPRIKVRNGAIVRDHHGNAKHGLRLPAIDVPTAAYYGELTKECAFTLGKTDPFGLRKLYRIYPTHDGYVALVRSAVAAAEQHGWLLPDDGHAVLVAARRSFIGE